MDETQAVASQEHADLEIIQLTDQAKRGDLSGLRQYLARTREEADWNDRTFVLDRVVPWIPLPTLDFACDTEPSAADLFVIRTSFFSSLAWKKRGSGTADKITEDRWNAASNCIKEALAARDRAVQLDPQDPTSHVRVLQSLGIFCPLWPEMQSTFQRAISLAPTIVDAHRPIVSIMSKRWAAAMNSRSSSPVPRLPKQLPAAIWPSASFGHTSSSTRTTFPSTITSKMPNNTCTVPASPMS